MAKRKRRAKKKVARKRTKRTSKKKSRGRRADGSVNRSQAIRDFLAANPGAGPSKVVDALSSKGIEVSSPLVSQVKARMGTSVKRRGRPRQAAKAAGGSRSRNDMVAVADLLQAKKLARQMGGVQRAKAALDALARLEA